MLSFAYFNEKFLNDLVMNIKRFIFEKIKKVFIFKLGFNECFK